MTFEPVWEDPADAQYSWRRHLGPLTRLYEDVFRVYYRHLKDCWEACASPMSKDHIPLFMHGYTYVRGPEPDAASEERLERLLSRIGPFRGTFYREEIRPEVVAIVERLRKHPKPTRPLHELDTHLEACIDGATYVIGFLHWKMAAGAVRGPKGPGFHWPDTYAEITGRPQMEAAVLLGNVTNELTRAVAKMRKLARIAASDPDLMKAVEAGDVEALDPTRPAHKKFRTGFRSLLRRYGQRTGAGWGSSTTWSSPTWNLRPEIPLGMIATFARSDLDAVDAKERAAARERRRLLRTVRRELTDPERLARFEDELKGAEALHDVIEDHNHWMDQCSVGVLREAADVIGQRLVRDGVIDDPDDVLHLSLDELRSPPPDARSLVEERKREHERREALDPPETIGDAPASFRMDFEDKGEGHVGNELRGVAASSGKFTGVARVRMPSPTFPDVAEDEVLVAVDAGPDWTPVFAILGAVVLDKGAAWQHAAVMAREFGIPAVTGVKEGTTVIKDGQTITVDGDAGIVSL